MTYGSRLRSIDRTGARFWPRSVAAEAVRETRLATTRIPEGKMIETSRGRSFVRVFALAVDSL